MAKFFSLSKVQFLNGLNKLFGKKAKSKTSMFFIGALIFLAIAVSFASMYFQMAKQLAEAGNPEFVFIQVGIVSTMFTVLMITLEAHSAFFKAKDYEMLSSFPLSPFSIVFAKFLSVLTSAYLYTAMTFIPGIIIYFIFAGFNIGIFFLLLLVVMIFPLFPTFLGVCFGLLSAFISSKTKHTKIFNLVLAIAFSALYIAFSVNYQNIIAFYIEKGADFITALTYFLPNLGLFMKGVFGGSVVSLILFVVIDIALIALTFFIVSLLYNTINKSFKNKQEYVSKKQVGYEQKNIIFTLIKKEANKYFNTSVYLFNTLSMALIGAVTPLIFYFSNVFPKDLISSVPIAEIITLLITITMASCNTSSVSISIEGNKFQNLKALPISERAIIFSKVIFNNILVLPIALISSILSIILYNSSLNIVSCLFVIFVPLLAISTSSLLGIIGNLYFPKMKFENDTQVVKQSFSAFIGIFGSMIFSGLPFIPYLAFLSSHISLLAFFFICIGYFLIFGSLFFVWIYIKGPKLIRQIEV